MIRSVLLIFALFAVCAAQFGYGPMMGGPMMMGGYGPMMGGGYGMGMMPPPPMMYGMGMYRPSLLGMLLG